MNYLIFPNDDLFTFIIKNAAVLLHWGAPFLSVNTRTIDLVLRTIEGAGEENLLQVPLQCVHLNFAKRFNLRQ